MPAPIPSAMPASIEKIGERGLRIVWEDGHDSLYPTSLLRRRCPCASCRDEWSGKPILDESSVPDDLGANDARLVGNYAIALSFSDGHATGIYPFETLRLLCPCRECSL